MSLLRRLIVRAWVSISGVDTVAGVAGWPAWKAIVGVLGGVSGATVSFLTAVPPWAWFLLIIGGVAGGLFITNELASIRLRRRLGGIDSSRDYGTATGNVEPALIPITEPVGAVSSKSTVAQEPVAPSPSYEDIARRVAFIDSFRAVADTLSAKLCSGLGYPHSFRSVLQKIEDDPSVKELLKSDDITLDVYRSDGRAI